MGKIYNSILLWLALISTAANGQNYLFRHYDVEEGLLSGYVNSISQDGKGFLWIANSAGLSRFDGGSFKNFGASQGLSIEGVSSFYNGQNGKMWIGHKNGSISVFENETFKNIVLDKKNESNVSGFFESHDGTLFVSTLGNGLFQIKQGKSTKIIGLEETSINAVTCVDEFIILGTEEGIKTGRILKGTFMPVEFNFPVVRVNCLSKGKTHNNVWIGTEDGIFKIGYNHQKLFLEPLADQFRISGEEVYDIKDVSSDEVWVATMTNGIYRLSKTFSNRITNLQHFDEASGLLSNNCRAVFQDREGITWVGYYGHGMSQMVDDYFTFYNETKQISSIANGASWYATNSSIKNIFTGQEYVISKDKDIEISCVYPVSENMFYIGTKTNGLYTYDLNKKLFKKVQIGQDNLFNNVNSINGDPNAIYVSTVAGLVVIKEGKVAKTYTTTEGLSHNNISSTFVDSKNRVWIASPGNDILYLKNDQIHRINVNKGSELLSVNAFAEDLHGNIWMATYGSGVLKYDNTSFTRLAEHDGLKSNYCYAISCDGKNKIWVGHRGGLSLIKSNLTIKTFGAAEGVKGDCNINSITRDNKKNIWIATNLGLVYHDALRKIKRTARPLINIMTVRFGEKDSPFQPSYRLPHNHNKIRIEFKGITFKDPSSIMYQYQMEGLDTNWSEPTKNNYVVFNQLPEGKYRFRVRTFNVTGQKSEPVLMTFVVTPPFWKRWWFVAGCVFIMIYIVYIIIKLRDKNHKAIQEYLESIVEQKTEEVINQKNLLERKNKDITDSITYARKIQDAILPPVDRLKEAFPESFVFYQPRDIVSGDFYWFHQMGNKYIVVCADATGHGVPGAFITMIASTLIKEICHNETITSPADMLEKLDHELQIVLKQTGTQAETQDGMDIVITEIDIETGKAKIASAMRPVFIVKNNEVVHLKRDRNIVGRADENGSKFYDKEVELQKGDSIYMFTDGVADQFGGPEGKKLKVSGLKQLIDKVKTLPMQEQLNSIKEYLFSWKSNLDQVDDMLMIGMKF